MEHPTPSHMNYKTLYAKSLCRIHELEVELVQIRHLTGTSFPPVSIPIDICVECHSMAEQGAFGTLHQCPKCRAARSLLKSAKQFAKQHGASEEEIERITMEEVNNKWTQKADGHTYQWALCNESNPTTIENMCLIKGRARKKTKWT